MRYSLVKFLFVIIFLICHIVADAQNERIYVTNFITPTTLIWEQNIPITGAGNYYTHGYEHISGQYFLKPIIGTSAYEDRTEIATELILEFAGSTTAAIYKDGKKVKDIACEMDMNLHVSGSVSADLYFNDSYVKSFTWHFGKPYGKCVSTETTLIIPQELIKNYQQANNITKTVGGSNAVAIAFLKNQCRFMNVQITKFKQFAPNNIILEAKALHHAELDAQKKLAEKEAAEKKAARDKEIAAQKEAEEKAKAQQNSTSQTNSSTKTSTADDDFWNDRPATSSAKPVNTETSVDAARRQMEQARINTERKQQEVDRIVGNATNLFSGAVEAQRAKEALEENITLSGNYSSIDALMADFNQKMANVNQLVENFQQQKVQNYNTYVDAIYGGNSSSDQTFNEGLKLAGAVINHYQAEKEKKEAKERLENQRKEAELRMEKQRQAMIREVEAERMRLLTGIRTDLFSRFKDSPLPLSTAKINSEVIYYFFYSYNPVQIGAKQPNAHVSNVFPISKYGDGTWPFKASIANEIKGLTPNNEVLFGYYTSKEKAESARNAFIKVFQKTGGQITAVNFKGKPGTSPSSGSSDDFWETGGSTTPAPQNNQKTNDDFWNN